MSGFVSWTAPVRCDNVKLQTHVQFVSMFPFTNGNMLTNCWFTNFWIALTWKKCLANKQDLSILQKSFLQVIMALNYMYLQCMESPNKDV